MNILKLTKPTGQSIHAVTQAYLQFGQKIDPVIMSRFYELFVNCQQVQQFDRDLMLSVMQTASFRDSLRLTGVSGGDCLSGAKMMILKRTQNSYRRVLRAYQELYGGGTGDDADEESDDQGDDEVNF